MYGVSVRTNKGLLIIPQPTLSGQCLYTAPVQYLKELDHSCTYELSNSLCSQSSVLSVLSYINKVNNVSVLAKGSSNQAASTSVIYKCPTNFDSYIKSTQTISDIVDNTQVYKFNYNLPTGQQCVDDCAVCDDFNDVPSTDTPSPDCGSQSPSTSLDVNGVCRNAVIDVDYTITWVGDTIEKLDAVITLADIPIQNAAGRNNILSQRYKTTYIHNVTMPGDGATDNFNNITDAPYQRSGKVGYDVGNMIWTGYEILNTTLSPPMFMYVNTNSSRQMAVFDTSKCNFHCMLSDLWLIYSFF